MQTQPARVRRYDLDWLRVLGILFVFFFHTGRFFSTDDWHLKNEQTYLAVQIWLAFMASWGMPFIFVISGASTFFSLGTRTRRAFLTDRTLRLLVPLVVGIFSHSILQVYLERISHGQFQGSLIDFLPHYFEGLYGYGGNFAWMGIHLWYLELLFVFSVVLLPVLWWLRHGTGSRLLEWLCRQLARPAGLLLLIPLSTLVASLPDYGRFLGGREWGGWSLLSYSIFFVCGFVLVASDAIRARIQALRWVALAGGVLAFLGLLSLWRVYDMPEGNSPYAQLFFALVGVNAWCWILGVWGFSTRHLNFGTPLLWYANEAVLPFYVMHQSVLLVVGYFVLQWPIPDLLKWLAITSVSLALIAALYLLLIRRHNLLRILFGMKPLPASAPSTRTAPWPWPRLTPPEAPKGSKSPKS